MSKKERSNKDIMMWGIAILLVFVGGIVYFSIGAEPKKEQVPKAATATSDIKEPPPSKQEESPKQPETSQSSSKLEVPAGDKKIVNEFGPENITQDMKGQTHTIVGRISKVSEGKGHVFFTVQSLQSNATIKGVLFSSDVKKNPERAQLIRDVYSSGAPVHIRGTIDIYEGALEIKAQRVFTE